MRLNYIVCIIRLLFNLRLYCWTCICSPT